MTANRFRFRAWAKDQKQMLYDIGEPDDFGGGDIAVPYAKYADGHCDYKRTSALRICSFGVLFYDAPDMGYYGGGDWTEACQDYILMQSTGLLDRNGKEIFEGDICIHYVREGLTKPREVFWFEGAFSVKGWATLQPLETMDGPRMAQLWPLASFLPAETFEVIGNRYENPELLTGAKA